MPAKKNETTVETPETVKVADESSSAIYDLSASSVDSKKRELPQVPQKDRVP